MQLRLTFLFFSICWCSVLITPRTVSAQIYSGTTIEGTVLLSNFPSAEASKLLIPDSTSIKLDLDPVTTSTKRSSKISSALMQMLEEVASEYQLDAHLLHAVIKVESDYNPRAQSPKGARGLMQLMPDTARRFGLSDPFNPRENVQAGARYLIWLLKLFNNDIELALAGYNAGEQAVIRAGYRLPDYPETRSYVPKVLRHYKLLGGS